MEYKGNSSATNYWRAFFQGGCAASSSKHIKPILPFSLEYLPTGAVLSMYAMRAESELPHEYRTLAKVRMHLRPRLKLRTAVPLPGRGWHPLSSSLILWPGLVAMFWRGITAVPLTRWACAVWSCSCTEYCTVLAWSLSVFARSLLSSAQSYVPRVVLLLC